MADLAWATLWPSLAVVVWRLMDFAVSWMLNRKGVMEALVDANSAVGKARAEVMLTREEGADRERRIQQLEHFEEVARGKLGMKARER